MNIITPAISRATTRLAVGTVLRHALVGLVCVFVSLNLLNAADRPWGLGYTPAYVPSYPSNPASSGSHIPTGAYDRASYGSTAAWLDACVAAGVAGKIGSGTYNITAADLLDGGGQPRYAPVGIYGYGATKPVFVFTGTVSESTRAFMYLGKFTAFTVRYVEFSGFGDVFDMAVGSVDRGAGLYAYQSPGTYAFCRHTPVGDTVGGDAGVGRLIDTTLFPRNTSMTESVRTVGPAVNIAYCTFTNCERAYAAGSDTVVHGRIDFHANLINGTYGALELNCTSYSEIYAANNEWTGLNATTGRFAPYDIDDSGPYTDPVNSHSFHTLFKIGVNNGIDVPLRGQKILIENNYAHDIEDRATKTDLNGAVFVDIRQATPVMFTTTNPATDTSDINISFNQVVDVRNTRGREDANAFYGKIRGGVIERNYVKNAGAARTASYGQGSEGSGMVFKEAGSMSSAPAGSFLAFRGNVFEDMPACPAAETLNKLSVIKLDLDPAVDLVLIGNDFVNCDNQAGGGANGLIRHYDPSGKITAWGNLMDNCVVSTSFMMFHGFSSPESGHEVSNNVALHGLDVNYAANQTLVTFNGTPSGLVTGQNFLLGSGGNYTMLVSPAGSGTAPVRTYTPPQIVVATVSSPAFSPAGGTYPGTQAVTITSATSGASIRYTTDGSTPSPTVGTLYSAPVSITTTSTLKAIAYKSGMTNSSVTSASYIINVGSGVFLMSGSSVSMEAEHYNSEVVAGGVNWTEITDAGASGGLANNAMQASPNTGVGSSAPGAGVARMDYSINVPTGGNFYVHVLSRAATTTDDSIWVSIDGGTTTYQQMGALTSGYGWRTSGSSFAIPTGIHSLTIWMREDGYILDKIVVKNSSTAPTGSGPAESPRS